MQTGLSRTYKFSIVAGAVAAGVVLTGLALGGAEARLPPEAAGDVATTAAPARGIAACGAACSSHVIASPVRGRPAIVVGGASAFGMALDAGAARVVRPAAVGGPAPARASDGVPAGRPAPAARPAPWRPGPSGGTVVAMWDGRSASFE